MVAKALGLKLVGGVLLVVGLWQLSTLATVQSHVKQTYSHLSNLAGEGSFGAGNRASDLIPGLPASAGNATLGFETIQFINLDYRYDLQDAVTMQALVSGLKIEHFSAVDAKTLGDTGLPPSSREDPPLKSTVKACFRSHANLWQKMLAEGWTSMLVLEADAAWDVNIRRQAQRISEGLVEIMRKYPDTAAEYKGSHAYDVARLVPSEDNPYLVENWDILALGQCIDDDGHQDEFVVVNDPEGPAQPFGFLGTEYKDSRIVRRLGGPVCTNAYAVSRQGALKLLLRAATDFDQPVDVVMHFMGKNQLLNGYSVYPTIFGQWEYKDGIGAENLNSDIDQYDTAVADNVKSIWSDIHTTFNVWKIKPEFAFTNFKAPALGVLGREAFGADTSTL